MLGRIPIGVRYMLLSALAFAFMGVFVKLAGQRMPTSERRIGGSKGLSWREAGWNGARG